MQSDTVESLCRKLLAITSRTRASLDEADPSVLKELEREQIEAMAQLSTAGLTGDQAALELAMEVKSQVHEVINLIAGRLGKVSQDLSDGVKRKHCKAAYLEAKRFQKNP